MKKTVHILVALFFITNSLFAQTNKIIDSLKLELNKKQADTIIAQILNDLSYYYLYENIDSSLVYGKKALIKSRKIHYDKVEAKANLYIGNAFLFTNRYDSARYYYNTSYKIFDSKGLNKSAIYSSLGMLYKYEENYEKAIKIYFEGITYDEETSNEYGKFIKLLNLANVYYIIENFEKSIQYQLEAVDLSEKTDNENIKYALGTILNNIGGNYLKMEKYDKALDYFNQSLKINIENENQKELARNYNNLGVVYENKNQLKKAEELLKKALKIRERMNDEDELVETHMELGILYGKQGKERLSNQHFSGALKLAKKIKNKALISEVYLAMSDIYVFQNKSEKALTSYKSHSKFRDSILEEKNIKNINALEIKFQTEKKDKEILTQQLELQKKNTQNNYMLGTVVFLALVSVLLMFLYNQRQKRKDQEILTLKREFQIKTLESLIEGEEKERLRIAKELHDGVNGDLSAIKYKLSSLIEMNNKVIKEAITMIDDSCKQVRAISHNLIPPSIENFNIIEATQEYCHNMDEVHEPQILFQHIGDPVSIPKKAEANLFRIIQELVTNSIKHAEASEINVQISNRENTIQLTVEDNGKGFDTDNIKSKGIGLSNVQSRLDYLQATRDVLSNQEGTSYTIEIDTEKLNDN